MRTLHLRGGRVMDPRRGVDGELDVIVREGKIERIAAGIAPPKDAISVDCRGAIVAPGFVDLHVHFREPGEEGKETIATGVRSAASGGFTSVCTMPNTNPVNDCRAITSLILSRAKEAGSTRVHPIGAISKGLAGQHLSEIGELHDAGVVGLSDDGRCVMNARLMRRALEYARGFGLTVIQHAEDHELSHGGVMNEGASATRAGLPGQPAEAEEVIVARDLILVELTGARYHVAHASTARTIELVRAAKKKGLPVTCEVTPHHLVLTDEACVSYDTHTKMYPPLRTQKDIDVLQAALADGTIDAIATDHAPHGRGQKQDVEFDCAAFGVIGLETALAITLALVREKKLAMDRAIERLTASHVLGIPGGTMPEGSEADIVVFDPELEWKVGPDTIHSKSKNTPFLGRTLRGRATLTIARGHVTHDLRGVAS